MTYDEEYRGNLCRSTSLRTGRDGKGAIIWSLCGRYQGKCADVKPGGGRIKDCVKTHAGEFSDACKARLARVAEISKACTTDVKESCPGKERSCILKSIGNVKDQCKAALAQSVAGTK